MRLNFFASVALLCSSVLAAPTQMRRQDGELGPLSGLLDSIESLAGGLNGTDSGIVGSLGGSIASIINGLR
jgi:hypothetical protein